MYTDSKRLVKTMHLIVHVVINAATFVITYQLRNLPIFSNVYGHLLPFDEYILPLVLVCLLWPFVFSTFKLYGVSSKPYRIISYMKIAVSVGLGDIILSTVLFFQRDIAVSRLFLLMFACVNFLGTIIMNECYRVIVKKALHNRRASKHILIIASDSHEKKVMQSLDNDSVHEIVIQNSIILDDKKTYIENLDRILADNVIDEVLFCLAQKHLNYLEEYIICCENMGIVANVMVTFYELPKSEVKVGHLGGVAVLKYTTTPQSQTNLLIKRIIDIVGGTIGLLITVVVALIIAPWIKLDSKGPIFFKQTRIGKNGREFTLYKFRSMYADAEEQREALENKNEMQGAMFKIEEDPRVTELGKILRKTSIDELPQFWNVIMGDMSLVGTRPPLPREVAVYKQHHWKRLSMKPGITGIWQTSGRNKIMDFEIITEMDAKYIDTWSLRKDIKLLYKTIKIVITGYGAS